ncbi:hypothetical protein ACFSJ3_18040 [Corallincola platygyrae]|uniref:Uncharacterized protein n=1 Tax=Corallincola platygyrae TaxID=1193278 RepID=A0ABW4XSC5_9GAMM
MVEQSSAGKKGDLNTPEFLMPYSEQHSIVKQLLGICRPWSGEFSGYRFTA